MLSAGDVYVQPIMETRSLGYNEKSKRKQNIYRFHMLKRSLFPFFISQRVSRSVRIARLFTVATQTQFRVDTTPRIDRYASLPSPYGHEELIITGALPTFHYKALQIPEIEYNRLEITRPSASSFSPSCSFVLLPIPIIY
jgi:hypothetical protein